VDTLENLVGVVETLAGAVFRAAVTDADERLKGKGNIFQRLDHTADLFVEAGYADLRTIMDSAMWQRLGETWAARHVFTHNDGVVDAKYLAKVPTSTVLPGQRLTVTEPVCRQAIVDAVELCRSIAALTEPWPVRTWRVRQGPAACELGKAGSVLTQRWSRRVRPDCWPGRAVERTHSGVY
jgi:hypothetical protein